NDDIQPKLIVIKHVINDNGGTKSASDFGITVTGSSPSPATFNGAESPGTNDDIAPKLIVIKHVINDNGGTKSASDFGITVTGNSPSPATFNGAESPGTNVAISTGSYGVEEGAHAGYTETKSADCDGTIALGETKTCTITNDDIGPKLIVIKHVINDDGGTKSADDFTMTVTGGTPASFPGA